jgi:hypothetical protein
VLLFTEHDGIIEIENDARIGAMQEGELERAETEGLEKQDDVVTPRLFDDFHLANHAGPAGGQHGGFDPKPRVLLQAVAQTQTRARSITVFNHAQSSHHW